MKNLSTLLSATAIILLIESYVPVLHVAAFASLPVHNDANRLHRNTCSAPLTPIPLHTRITRPQQEPISSSSTHLSMMNLEDAIYAAQSSASALTSVANMSGSPSSLFILYVAGLLTSFSPCALSLLPLTLSYISNAAGERNDKAAFFPTLAFAGGLASVFCGLGLSVSLLGGVFGKTGGAADSILGTLVLVTLSSGVSVAMGLQLLELVDIPLPSFELELPSFDSNKNGEEDGMENGSTELQFDDDGNMIMEPPPMSYETNTDSSSNGEDSMALFRTFLLGGSSALIASPCATPVLTSILAFVAASQNPTLGATLLFTYTLGYTTPLLVVGATGGGALARAQAMADGEDASQSIVGRIGGVVTPLTGGFLVAYGTTGFLNALLGDPSVVALAPVL